DGIRDGHVTGVQTCALPICLVSNTRDRPGTGQQVQRCTFIKFLLLNGHAQAPRNWHLPTNSPFYRALPRRERGAPRRESGRREKIGRASCRERVEKAGVG